MEPKTSNFQVIVLLIFGFFIILSIVLFATNKSKTGVNSVDVTPVVMWGSVPSSFIKDFTAGILEKNKGSLSITYVEKNPKTLEKDLVSAIADGIGPDILILPQDLLVKNINKFTVIPYTSYPLRTFKDQFIDAGSVYLRSDGVAAIPFIIDPMVMYWNKAHFINASIINPPTQWDEFSKDVLKLTKKDSNFNITQSGTALGEYQNITHAKDILSMLFIQAGVPIVSKDSADEFSANLSNIGAESEKQPASIALSFYTDFSNPTKEIYSWNKSLRQSLDAFIFGDTSIYFGYASELASMSLKNPNLNFDVAKVPQVPSANKKSVFAKIYGLAVLKSSKNQASAFNQIFTLTSKDSIASLTSIMSLPPVRRDVLENVPSNQYMKVFYDSALLADTFPDPDSENTEALFQGMIESVISGKNTSDLSVNIAQQQLQNIIKSIVKVK